MPFKPLESYELDRSDSPALLRKSIDEASDYSDVDELDPLKHSSQQYTDDATQPLRNVFDADGDRSFAGKPLAWLDRQRQRGGLRRWLIPSRFCCMLMLLFSTTLLPLLSAGGIWVYKSSVPEDGQSDPWYPSPLGGTVKSWEESYRKAAELVGKMTLV